MNTASITPRPSADRNDVTRIDHDQRDATALACHDAFRTLIDVRNTRPAMTRRSASVCASTLTVTSISRYGRSLPERHARHLGTRDHSGSRRQAESRQPLFREQRVAIIWLLRQAESELVDFDDG